MRAYRWLVLAALGILLLPACRMNEPGTRDFQRRSRPAARGQMNPGDWPQSETGSPGTGVPPI